MRCKHCESSACCSRPQAMHTPWRTMLTPSLPQANPLNPTPVPPQLAPPRHSRWPGHSVSLTLPIGGLWCSGGWLPCVSRWRPSPLCTAAGAALWLTARAAAWRWAQSMQVGGCGGMGWGGGQGRAGQASRGTLAACRTSWVRGGHHTSGEGVATPRSGAWQTYNHKQALWAGRRAC